MEKLASSADNGSNIVAPVTSVTITMAALATRTPLIPE
jgi:hypothetical protein